MKSLRIISVACAVILAVCGCKEEVHGPSSFALQEEIFDVLAFEYGQTKELPVLMENINVRYVKCSQGWKGELEDKLLRITAPVQDTAVSSNGEIGLYARGYDNVEWILKLDVEVKQEVKEGETQSWIASREGNELISALWKPGDTAKSYDASDTDGYPLESSVTIPEEGVAEIMLSGVVSPGDSIVYAVSPSISGVLCSPEGVVSGLEFGSEQRTSENLPVLAVARNAEEKMQFKNVYSYLTATFEDDMIAKLVIEDPDGDCALAGTFSYDISSLTASFSEKSSSLTLLPAEDKETFSAGTYGFACMPGQLSGMQITAFTATGKKMVKTIDGDVSLKRNGVYNLGSFKNELVIHDKSGWRLLYCNSELLENFSGQEYVGADGDTYTGSANDLIDGDYASFWSYYYRPADTPKTDAPNIPPYHIVIDLGSEKTISSMKLTARQPKGDHSEYKDDAWTYQIARLKVEFSNNITKRGMADHLDNGKSDWTDSESFDESVLNNQKINRVNFAESHTARYIRLTVGEGYKTNTETTPTYTGATLAEFDLYSGTDAKDADKISKADWKIVYAKSERCENYGSQGMVSYGGWSGAARHMIDDDYLSLWSYHAAHTSASAIPTVRHMPYYFVIDFGKEIDVAAFRMTNKWAKNNFADQTSFASGPGGVILEFSSSISGRGMDDILEHGQYVTDEWTLCGEYDHTVIRKQKEITVPLPGAVKARYCRFTITKAYRDSDLDGGLPTGGYGTSLAELDFFE